MSFSITFRTPALLRQAHVHAFNGQLRRLGLHLEPDSPGRLRHSPAHWAQRFPAPFPGQACCIEVRPLMGGVDLPPEDAERVIREQLAAIKRGK